MDTDFYLFYNETADYYFKLAFLLVTYILMFVAYVFASIEFRRQNKERALLPPGQALALKKADTRDMQTFSL